MGLNIIYTWMWTPCDYCEPEQEEDCPECEAAGGVWERITYQIHADGTIILGDEYGTQIEVDQVIYELKPEHPQWSALNGKPEVEAQ
jgi:hypothetical protein